MFGAHARLLQFSLTMLGGPPDAGSSDDDAALQLARVHYHRGEVRYHNGKYAEAVHEYHESLVVLPAGPAFESYRVRGLWSLVRARKAGFEQGGARDLLCPAEAELAELLPRSWPPDLEAGRADMEALRGTIAAECHPPEPKVEPPPAAPAVIVTAPTSAPAPTTEVEPVQPATPKSGARPGRALIVGGGALTGIGVAALGGMAASLALGARANDRLRDSLPGDERTAADADGQRANVAAIVTAVVGGAATLAGVTMIAVGERRRHRVDWLPAIRPGAAALSIRIRF